MTIPEQTRLTWLVWRKTDPKVGAEASLQAALAHFQSKYGHKPNRLEAPLGWPELPTNGLRVERKWHVRPAHLHLAFDPSLHREEA